MVTGSREDCLAGRHPSIAHDMDKRMHDPAGDIQDILKCKWALRILGEIAAGSTRPSTIERSVPGLSHKVLHERLNKLARLAVVERVELAAKAQAVSYRLTPYGQELGGILDQIRRLGERYRPARSARTAEGA